MQGEREGNVIRNIVFLYSYRIIVYNENGALAVNKLRKNMHCQNFYYIDFHGFILSSFAERDSYIRNPICIFGMHVL